MKSSRGCEPGDGRRYPRTMICAVWRVSRSTVYARRALRPAAIARSVAADAARSCDARDRDPASRASPFHTEGIARCGSACAPGHSRRQAARLAAHAHAPAPSAARRGHARGDRAHGARSQRRARMNSGAPMRRGSPPSRTAGAGSSSTTATSSRSARQALTQPATPGARTTLAPDSAPTTWVSGTALRF